MNQPNQFTLLGVSLTSMAILVLEIVFTRIFSVLMWYHFAFMVISLALLGSGAAGVWLYLAERRFPREKTNERLALLALLFAFGTIISFLVYLQIPFEFKTITKEGLSWATVGWLTLIYLVLSVPFLLGGATIALAISRFSQSAGRVYAYDLIGASIGCLLSIVVLINLGAASGVLFVSLLTAVAALLFARDASQKRWRVASAASILLLLAIVVSNMTLGWLAVRSRGGYDKRNVLIYEKWNALARISVYEDPHWLQPFGWGLSPIYEGPDPGHLMLLIDANAGTPIQKWDGSWEMIDFLRYDLTTIAYNILPEAKTFIIGTGGGRDILTGLLFGAREIVGAELNPAIVEAARDEFGDYAGNVYDYPNVRVEIEDARTFLARSDEQFDLIQASLIDTWAAASSGAFSLSENGLYTRDAFEVFYRRLSPRGMVSYSRWYFIEDPTETLRLVALGLDTWRRMGVDDPAAHMVVIANFSQNRSADKGLATVLLKKTPFTPQEVAALAEISQAMEFTLLYAPGVISAPNPVQELVTAPDLEAAIAAYPLDISAPTDDRPFFFNFTPYRTLGRADLVSNPAYRSSAEGNFALLAVLGISAVLAILFIILPLFLRRGAAFSLAGNWPFLLYYAAIGVGFMLIMVPAIQRLTIYLGSPTYALAVVLFTILLSSGIGSRATNRVPDAGVRGRLRLAILALIVVVALQLLFIPFIVPRTQAWPFALRVAMVIAVIFPAGFFMGQPFPLGVKWIGRRRESIIPWLWAINGVASVIGSVLATVIGLAYGFRVVSLAGILCYGLALTLAVLIWERKARPAPLVEPSVS
ncbi:MAG TPA: hypothetical protein ENK32_05855 [Anaerolineae bacterium]|nr:hypothetical protein [Anaerolineae bacterium]